VQRKGKFKTGGGGETLVGSHDMTCSLSSGKNSSTGKFFLNGKTEVSIGFFLVAKFRYISFLKIYICIHKKIIKFSVGRKNIKGFLNFCIFIFCFTATDLAKSSYR
jgi:hypothetical protein